MEKKRIRENSQQGSRQFSNTSGITGSFDQNGNSPSIPSSPNQSLSKSPGAQFAAPIAVDVVPPVDELDPTLAELRAELTAASESIGHVDDLGVLGGLKVDESPEQYFNLLSSNADSDRTMALSGMNSGSAAESGEVGVSANGIF